MATVTAFIRVSKKGIGLAKVRFRLRDGRDVQLFHKSDIEVEPDLWDDKKECYRAKCIIDTDKRMLLSKAVADRKILLLQIYNNADKSTLGSEMFELLIDKAINPGKYTDLKNEGFFDAFDVFLEKRKMSEERKEGYLVIKRALQRYELFLSMNEGKPFRLELDKLTTETLEDFESFLRNEHALSEEYPQLDEAIPLKKQRKQKQRGQNRINDIFSRIRSFILWSVDTGRTTNNPFRNFTIEECVYGTPIYITLEERNTIYNTDLSHRPQLAIQRDIFIFQSLIGCRVGDLYAMTKQNVVNGAIEYIARKTKDERPVTVRVPLNSIAVDILSRYTDENNRLLPFISQQRYNDAIKEVFELAGITRIVTVINPTTGNEEKRSINEVASSHLARRTFIGNIYKKVKDPNLVGALSGHKEGSRAFARYRDIDEEMRAELVKILE